MGRITRSLVLLAAASLGCSSETAGSAPADVPHRVAEGILAACPLVDATDEGARDACAAELGRLDVLRDAQAEPFLWGGQSEDGDYDLSHSSTTRMNPLVWRKLYLSLMMFTGEASFEESGGQTIVHLPYRLRELDAGAYPYPFWHKPEKWASYQQAAEVLLIFEGDTITGGLRSKKTEASRPATERAWDGHFTWVDAKGQVEPYVTLYSYLLSPNNPHVAELDAAYRAFEARSRNHHCMDCHSPANSLSGSPKQNPLELFAFPNQALAARHAIVQQLSEDRMPLVTGDAPAGIPRYSDRRALLALAQSFEAVADQALGWEGEPAGR